MPLELLGSVVTAVRVVRSMQKMYTVVIVETEVKYVRLGKCRLLFL